MYDYTYMSYPFIRLHLPLFQHHQELPPVQTDVKPVRYSVDSATPRAQDLQDMINESNRLRSSSTSSLESKPAPFRIIIHGIVNRSRNRGTNRSRGR